MLALAASSAIAAVATSDEPSEGQVVQTVSYTTGQQGAKLKWLPYRPAKTAGVGRPALIPPRLATAQYHKPIEPARPTLADPKKNPFGDPRILPPLKPAAKYGGNGPDDETPKLLPSAPRRVPTLPSPDVKQSDGKQSDDGQRRVPPIDIELDTDTDVVDDACKEAFDFKKIGVIDYDIAAEKGELPSECPLKKREFEPRSWVPTTFAWKASGLCHKPLYFENVQLERYGHSWGPYLQPVISQGHFFLSVPVLPYMMGLCPPNECQYTLGYYRPGNCAPYMLDPLPISIRAALFEAGAWTGAAYLIP